MAQALAFRGSANGAALILGAGIGAKSIAASGGGGGPWGSENGSLSFTERTHTVRTAPGPMRVKATVTGLTHDAADANHDPAYTQITYIWTLQKWNGSAYVTATLPAFTNPRLVTGWNNPNTMYNREVTFSITEPGQYRAHCLAVDRNGDWGEGTSTVYTYDDPDTVYATTQTYVVSDGADYTGKPTGAVEITSSGVQSAINGSTSGSPRRILFRAGETFTSLRMLLGSGDYVPFIGSFGTGAKPIFDHDAIDSNNWEHFHVESGYSGDQVTLNGLDLRGGWDATTETWEYLYGAIDLRKGIDFFAHDSISSATISGTSQSDGAWWCFSDCDLSGRGYCVLSADDPNSDWEFIGCAIERPADALQGGPKDGFHNINAAVRIEAAQRLHTAACSYYNCSGWSGNPSNNNPCLRYGQDGPAAGYDVSIDRCTFEGGFRTIDIDKNVGTGNPGNIVIDKVLLVGTSRTISYFIHSTNSGMCVRNALAVLPDVDYFADGVVTNAVADYLVNTALDSTNSDNLTYPIEIYGSSFIILTQQAQENGRLIPLIHRDEFSNATDVTEENNVLHAPDITPANAVTTFDPLDEATAVPGYTPKYPGVRYGYEKVTFILSTYSGSDVVDGGTFELPFADIPQRDVYDVQNGGVLTKAQWDTLLAVDDRHLLKIGSVEHSLDGYFSVSTSATGVVITNDSGGTWLGTDTFVLRLDRKSRLDTDLPMLTQYATGATDIKTGRPQTGSSAITGAANSGLIPYDDFFGNVRDHTAMVKGALLAA